MLQCPPSLSLGCRCTCPLCCQQDMSPSLGPVCPKSLSLPTRGKCFSPSCLEQTPRGAPCFLGLRASTAEASAWRLLLEQLFLDSSGGEKEQGRLECFTGQTQSIGCWLASLRKSGFLAQTKGLRGAGVSCPWRYPRTDVLGRLQEQASVERCFSPPSTTCGSGTSCSSDRAFVLRSLWVIFLALPCLIASWSGATFGICDILW